MNKLGERLAKLDVPDQEALRRLADVRDMYDEALEGVTNVLRGTLNLHPTTRLKSGNTIVEKLKRERTRLSKMQDIAGARIVLPMILREQDEVAARILRHFPDATMMDRRAAPNNGYRAVHVVVTSGGLPVEIQIRTHHQDVWAQAFEKLADLVGRGIRYGETAEEADAALVQSMLRDSALVAEYEALADEGVHEDLTERLHSLGEDIEDSLRSWRNNFEEWTRMRSTTKRRGDK